MRECEMNSASFISETDHSSIEPAAQWLDQTPLIGEFLERNPVVVALVPATDAFAHQPSVTK
jgi:hypothetical protein